MRGLGAPALAAPAGAVSPAAGSSAAVAAVVPKGVGRIGPLVFAVAQAAVSLAAASFAAGAAGAPKRARRLGALVLAALTAAFSPGEASLAAAAAEATAPSLAASAAALGDALDRLDRSLWLATPDGRFRLDLSGLVDLEYQTFDRAPPGLVFGGSSDVFAPRLTLFLDARLGERLYGFVEARADRGFDPRSDSPSARFDQYLLRWTPFEDVAASLQAGKFATVFGDWVGRSHSWENPLVNAPLAYENVTAAADRAVAPGPRAFLDRRNVLDKKRQWSAVVWGPSDATGAAAFGRLAALEWAVEVKNAALASRPRDWEWRRRGFDHPTVTGRLGARPAAAWKLGASASRGPYLDDSVRAALPAGKQLGDYHQTVVGADATFATRRLELWAEMVLARFEVPNVESADVAGWFVEARWSLSHAVFLAARWNQQLFEEIDDGAGRQVAWDRDAWRLDLGAGCRLARHLQAKAQYAFTEQAGRPRQGEHLGALQVTLRF